MSDSASATASAPAVLKLPDELLLSILARPQLGYRDLKRFSRVCRRFHAVEQTTALPDLQDKGLDYKLFREGPAQRQVKEGYEVTSHPVFDVLFLTTSGDEAMIYLSPTPESRNMLIHEACTRRYRHLLADEEMSGEEGRAGRGGDAALKTITLPCASEYATSPASLRLRFAMAAEPYVLDPIVHNPLGVTVRDLSVAVTGFWASQAAEHIPLTAPALENDDASEEPMVEYCRVDYWREVIGNDGWWQGVEDAVALGDGYAKLVPESVGGY
ncbi:hypothetical protein JCM5296_001927 [Sporobolomyces johnsonii]